MGRPPVVERMGEPNRGPWTPEEDIALVSYIQEHGPSNWSKVPNNAGLQRCGKSCRLRWKNYLRPGIKRGNFTPEEDMKIVHYQALFGNRWASIAANLSGRTDNDVKNYWHTNLKKKLGKVNRCGDDTKNNEGLKDNGDAAAESSVHATLNNGKKSACDDMGFSPLKLIEKWLLEDPSAPFPQDLFTSALAPVPQVIPALVSASVPQVPPAPVHQVLPALVSAPVPSVPIHQVLSAPVPAPVPPAPMHQVLSAPAPWVPTAPFSQVPSTRAPPLPQVSLAQAPAPSTAPGHEGHDYLLNMFPFLS